MFIGDNNGNRFLEYMAFDEYMKKSKESWEKDAKEKKEKDKKKGKTLDISLPTMLFILIATAPIVGSLGAYIVTWGAVKYLTALQELTKALQ